MENVSFALLKETYPFKILKKCLDLSRIFKDTMLISLDFRDYNNWYAMALDLNTKKKGMDICRAPLQVSSSFYRWRNEGRRRWSTWHESIELTNGRARSQTLDSQAPRPFYPSSVIPSCFPHHCGIGSLILILESAFLFDTLRRDSKSALRSGFENPPLRCV